MEIPHATPQRVVAYVRPHLPGTHTPVAGLLISYAAAGKLKGIDTDFDLVTTTWLTIEGFFTYQNDKCTKWAGSSPLTGAPTDFAPYDRAQTNAAEL